MVVREVRREATVGGVVLVLGMGVNGVMGVAYHNDAIVVVAAADGLRLLFFDASYLRRHWPIRRVAVAGLSIASFVDVPLLFLISWLFSVRFW